jgi:hypothetical protein
MKGLFFSYSEQFLQSTAHQKNIVKFFVRSVLHSLTERKRMRKKNQLRIKGLVEIFLYLLDTEHVSRKCVGESGGEDCDRQGMKRIKTLAEEYKNASKKIFFVFLV